MLVERTDAAILYWSWLVVRNSKATVFVTKKGVISKIETLSYSKF